MAEQNVGIKLEAIRQQLKSIDERVRSLDDSVRPLLLGRSGDEAAFGQLRRDLDQSHEKHRAHFDRFRQIDDRLAKFERDLEHRISESTQTLEKRLDRIEARISRAQWVGVGAWAVIVFLWQALPPGWLAGLLGLSAP